MLYLDHSATTPTDPRVVEAMLPYFTTIYGNASSTYRLGREANRAIHTARETIAAILKCQPDELIFTSGGTESDNLALRGAAWAKREHGNHLITTPLEHSAITKTVQQLTERQGFAADVLAVNREGRVCPESLAAVCRPTTTLLSVMLVNNEVGTIQPVRALADQAHAQGLLVHTDAVQGGGQLNLDVQALGVDLLSLSAHKFYGPKGVGLLYVRGGSAIIAAQTGGGQERGLRAGTYATPLIVGLAKALELAYHELPQRIAHYQHLRNRLIEGVLGSIADCALTGHPTERLPSHASFVFEGLSGANLVLLLDEYGIATSSTSACKAGNAEPSAVLLALGYSAALAASSLRLTVGTHTTEADIDHTLEILAQAVRQLRRLSSSVSSQAAVVH